MPVFSGLFLIIVMGSAGLPALSGFVGEFLTILGTFIAGDTLPAGYSLPMPRLLGGLAATGVVLGAVYLLWMFQKVFFGKLDKAKNGKLKDLNGRELATFVPLVIGIFVLGLFRTLLRRWSGVVGSEGSRPRHRVEKHRIASGSGNQAASAPKGATPGAAAGAEAAGDPPARAHRGRGSVGRCGSAGRRVPGGGSSRAVLHRARHAGAPPAGAPGGSAAAFAVPAARDPEGRHDVRREPPRLSFPI
jgi:hypothetical protein